MTDFKEFQPPDSGKISFELHFDAGPAMELLRKRLHHHDGYAENLESFTTSRRGFAAGQTLNVELQGKQAIRTIATVEDEPEKPGFVRVTLAPFTCPDCA